MPNRVFGELPGCPEGTYFSSRIEASRAGIHRPTQGGISGSADQGADSIVVSGGYEDDRDKGFEIEYIGHGGRDPETGEQVTDQEMLGGNLALKYSYEHELPIRVLRGASSHSVFAPKAGYRYDGLYRVVDIRQQKGRSGHLVWKFLLAKIDPDSAPWNSPLPSHLAGSTKKTLNSKSSTKAKLPKTVRPPSAVISTPKLPLTPEVPSFNVGDKVVHPTFGGGEVVAVSPFGTQDSFVTVVFTDLGSKRLVASKANLTRSP
jgi:hypothetical protein